MQIITITQEITALIDSLAFKNVDVTLYLCTKMYEINGGKDVQHIRRKIMAADYCRVLQNYKNLSVKHKTTQCRRQI